VPGAGIEPAPPEEEGGLRPLVHVSVVSSSPSSVLWSAAPVRAVSLVLCCSAACPQILCTFCAPWSGPVTSSTVHISPNTRVIIRGFPGGVGGCCEHARMSNFPCLVRSVSPSGETRFALVDPLVDRYLAFVAGRARAETLRATAFDLKTFFTVVSKSPVDVVAADVFEFLAHQRGDRSVIRIADRGSGLSARTMARRLSSVSGFYPYLVARGDAPVISNPVPRGLSTRRQGGSKRSQSVPLVRVPRTLPTILSPTEVQSLLSALRTHRDGAMIFAMLLGGLRRCEVLACD
jgi:Phage integrase, N-terminal SAM-like domain